MTVSHRASGLGDSASHLVASRRTGIAADGGRASRCDRRYDARGKRTFRLRVAAGTRTIGGRPAFSRRGYGLGGTRSVFRGRLVTGVRMATASRDTCTARAHANDGAARVTERTSVTRGRFANSKLSQ